MTVISILLFLSYTSHVAAQTASCTLTTNTPYKSPGNPSVYYISSDCKKRPIKSSQVYFSHFSSWSQVKVTSAKAIENIPDHELSFLPWGPNRVFENGSLVKTVDDPRVYLYVNKELHPINSYDVFVGLGYTAQSVEDVSADVLTKYEKKGLITNTANVPNGVVFKYPDSPSVYMVVRSQNGTAEKQYVQSVEDLKKVYRLDRLITLPKTVTFTDKPGNVIPPQASPTPPPTQSPTPNPTPTVAPGAPVVSLISPSDNSSYPRLAIINMRANATDTNGRIVHVEFYNGNTLLRRDTVAPYTYDWVSPPRGTYVLTAKAKDNSGLVSTSAPATIIVDGGSPSPAPGTTPPPPGTPGPGPTPSPTPGPTPSPTPSPEPSPSPTPTPTPNPTPSPTPNPAPVPQPQPVSSLSNARSAIGTNLNPLVDFGANQIYVDLFKQAREWIWGQRNGCWNCGPVGSTDSNGWAIPTGTQAARAIVLTNVNGGLSTDYYEPGTYTVLYEGQGTVSYGGSVTVLEHTPGRDVLSVQSSANSYWYIEISGSNTSNPIRNIRVYPPGGACSHDASISCTQNSQCGSGNTCRIYATDTNPPLFRADFLRDTRGMSVIRWMQPMRTNEAGIERIVNPSDWTQVQSAMYRVPPPEIIGAAANTLRNDVWVTMPVNGSDAFVRNFATRLRDSMTSQGNTQSRVFVEYSNESWNGAGDYADEQRIVAQNGCRRSTNSDLRSGCDQDQNPGNGIYCEGHPWPTRVNACVTAEFREFSERTVEIGRIFKEVFSNSPRVVRVMASQVNGVFRHEMLLNWKNAGAEIDALATAPYFGGDLGTRSEVVSWSLDQLFNELNTNSMTDVTNWISNDYNWLRQYYPNIDLIAYEGGQHLVGVGALMDNASIIDLFRRANNDPRMASVYARYLDIWRLGGGKTFAHFVDVTPQSRYGNFGAKTARTQPDENAPKQLALNSFIASHPCWWTGCEYGGSWFGGNTPPSPSPTPNPTPSPNPAPVVSLTSPTNGSTVTVGNSITVSASASDANSIGRVEFYQGSSLIASDSTSPYSITWTPGSTGSYTLFARAYDTLGANTNSASVTITVNAVATPPPPPPAPPSPPPSANDLPVSWSGNTVRIGTYDAVTVNVPPGNDGVTPRTLLVVLHGHTWSGDGTANSFMINNSQNISRYNYFYVAPNGHTTGQTEGNFWNAYSFCCGGNKTRDDVGFIRQLISEVRSHYPVINQVYLMGQSNGSMMAYRFAQSQPNMVSGIVTWAGMDDGASGSAPVNTLHIHGTSDGSVPFSSGEATMNRWAALAGCNTSQRTLLANNYDVVGDVSGAETRVYQYRTGCRSDIVADFWRVENASHAGNFHLTGSQYILDWIMSGSRGGSTQPPPSPTTPPPPPPTPPPATPTPTPSSGSITLTNNNTYFSWTSSYPQTMLVFSPNPNPTFPGVPDGQYYYRTTDQSAYISGRTGTWYVRVCEYNTSTNTCTSNYSNQLTVTF